jgi:hypothetical protein
MRVHAIDEEAGSSAHVTAGVAKSGQALVANAGCGLIIPRKVARAADIDYTGRSKFCKRRSWLAEMPGTVSHT